VGCVRWREWLELQVERVGGRECLLWAHSGYLKLDYPHRLLVLLQTGIIVIHNHSLCKHFLTHGHVLFPHVHSPCLGRRALRLLLLLCGWLWLRLPPTTKPGSQDAPGPAILLMLLPLLLHLAMVVVAWAACVPSETAAAKRKVMLAHDNEKAGLCLRLKRPGAAIVGQGAAAQTVKAVWWFEGDRVSVLVLALVFVSRPLSLAFACPPPNHSLAPHNTLANINRRARCCSSRSSALLSRFYRQPSSYFRIGKRGISSGEARPRDCT